MKLRHIAWLVIPLFALVLAGTSPVGSAQTGSGSPPPTYDYDDGTPGTQGPTSRLLAGAEWCALRVFDVTIPIVVPMAELQAVLPPGFKPRIALIDPNSGESQTEVTLRFIFEERLTHIADGQAFGPGSGLFLMCSVMNMNLTPWRAELGTFGFESTSQELVDFYNTTIGSGYARLATKATVQITQDAGTLSFKFNVTDDGLGLDVSAEATCPGPIFERAGRDPMTAPGRYFTIPPRSAFWATQRDRRVVPVGEANAKVETPDGKLHISVPGGSTGSLTISGISGNAIFRRNYEYFAKFEQE